MAIFEQQGTKFSFSVVPPDGVWNGHWVRTRICVENEFIHYDEISERMSIEEIREWLCLIARFLAGAFPKNPEFLTEKSGFAADFYPYSDDDRALTREECRNVDCLMALRFLFKNSEGKFMSGIYSFLLQEFPKEIEQKTQLDK